MKNILSINALILFVIFSINLSSQVKYKDYSLSAGFSINGNIHSSDFQQLPGIKNCCVKFNGAFGIGSSFFIGGEYLLPKSTFNMRSSYNLLLSYSSLSANFSEDEFIGNLIKESSYTKGISEHKINTSISAIVIDQGLTLYPFENMALGFRPGIAVAFPIKSDFDQSENLKDAGTSTYENGQTSRGHANGKIPNTTTGVVFATLGVRYDLFQIGDIKLIPQLQFNFALNNLVSSVNWKPHSLNLGLSANYMVPKAAKINPVFPPLPPLPLPPAPVMLTMNLEVTHNNKVLNDSDVLKFRSTLIKNVKRYSVLPMVFFDKNSAKIEFENTKPKDEVNAQRNSIAAVIQYLKENREVSVKITVSATDDEDETIIVQRRDAVTDLLKKSGIQDKRFSINENLVKRAKLKNPETTEEERNLQFSFSDNSTILHLNGEESTISQFEPLNIEVKPKIESDIQNTSFTGEVKYANNKLTNLLKRTNEIEIKNNPELTTSVINIYGEAKNPDGTIIKKEMNIKTSAEVIKTIYNENVILDESDNSTYKQFVLGFFKFDESEFSILSKDVLNQVREAVNNNQTVQVLPLTDRTGTKEHNARLAITRLNAALDALKLTRKDVQVIIPQDFIFTNDTPEGRLMNRTVIVRIKDK